MVSALKIIDHAQTTGSCSRAVSLNVIDGNGKALPEKFRGRAAIVTLGCSKNQVDSEVMLGVLRNHGYEIVSDLSVADVAIVNTCGFLESAVRESIDAILDVAEQKEKGRLRRLIVAGCAVSRYRDKLEKELPEVDAFITTEEILKAGEAADLGFKSALNDAARPYFLYDDTVPRILATKQHTAYVKIAEGCNRPCTFCIIPKIRGAMRSRDLNSVVREVESLGTQGVKEINLLAQDLTSYGTDIKGPKLAELLRAIDRAEAVKWIRLLYAYPIGIDEELLDAIVGLPSVCEYLDFPLQHSSERVLKAMKRPLGKFAPQRIVEFIKNRAPSIHLRTTLIVGFPGETEEDIKDLEAFIKEGHFTSVGVFSYSREQGTPSHDMDSQVSEGAKLERCDRIMRAQQEVNEKRLRSFIGNKMEVLVEGSHNETDLLLVGRSRFQAPEVDGTIIINDIENQTEEDSDLSDAIGNIYSVEITDSAGYDLVGRLVANG